MSSFSIPVLAACDHRVTNSWRLSLRAKTLSIVDFYTDIEAARRDIVELRKEIVTDLVSPLWKIYLEKIETHPVSKDTTLIFLNQGISAFIKTYEVVDIIE
jgi:hypothetical protein